MVYEDLEKYLSLSDAAKEYGVSHNYLRFLIFDERLEAKKIGRNWVVKREWLDAYFSAVKRRNRNGSKVFQPSTNLVAVAPINTKSIITDNKRLSKTKKTLINDRHESKGLSEEKEKSSDRILSVLFSSEEPIHRSNISWDFLPAFLRKSDIKIGILTLTTFIFLSFTVVLGFNAENSIKDSVILSNLQINSPKPSELLTRVNIPVGVFVHQAERLRRSLTSAGKRDFGSFRVREQILIVKLPDVKFFDKEFSLQNRFNENFKNFKIGIKKDLSKLSGILKFVFNVKAAKISFLKNSFDLPKISLPDIHVAVPSLYGLSFESQKRKAAEYRATIKESLQITYKQSGYLKKNLFKRLDEISFAPKIVLPALSFSSPKISFDLPQISIAKNLPAPQVKMERFSFLGEKILAVNFSSLNIKLPELSLPKISLFDFPFMKFPKLSLSQFGTLNFSLPKAPRFSELSIKSSDSPIFDISGFSAKLTSLIPGMSLPNFAVLSLNPIERLTRGALQKLDQASISPLDNLLSFPKFKLPSFSLPDLRLADFFKKKDKIADENKFWEETIRKTKEQKNGNESILGTQEILSEPDTLKAAEIIFQTNPASQQQITKVKQITQIEKRESIIPADLSSFKEEFLAMLNKLKDDISNVRSLYARLSSENIAQSRVITLTQKIDQLNEVKISNATFSGSNDFNLTDNDVPNSITISGNQVIGDLVANNVTLGDKATHTLTLNSGSISIKNQATTTIPTNTFNAFSFATSTNAIPFLTFDTQNYRIGVGTTVPARTFSIAGDLITSGNTSIGGALVVSGTNSTSTLTAPFSLTRSPTRAHTFTTWTVNNTLSEIQDSTLLINPSSASADTNLIGAAVNNQVKFLVDAEGDVFVNTLTSEGSVTTGSTTNSSLLIENSTYIGDAIGDLFSINSGDLRFNNLATSTIVNNRINAWSIATSATARPILSIDTLNNGSTTFAGIINVASSSATSTFTGSIQANALNITSGTATSTFSNGIQLSGGCFLLRDGTCAGAGIKIGNSVADGTSGSILFVDSSNNLAQDNSNLFWDDSNNRLGLGSTTPGSILSIQGSANFVQGATSTIYTPLSVLSFTATSTGATSTISGFLNITGTNSTSTISGGLAAGTLNITSGTATSTFSNGIQLSAGCFKLADGTCAGAGGGGTSIGGAVTSGTSGSILFVDSSGNLAQDNANLFWNDTNNRFGLGSTTPTGILSLEFDTTNSYPVWIGDQGTTTPTFVITGGGRVGIGTSSPSNLFSVHGNAMFSTTTVNGLIATGTVTVAGTLGIGTTSPREKLTLADGNFLQTSGSPQIIASLNFGVVNVTDIFVSGKYAYVGMSNVTGNEFQIIDISEPKNPVSVGGYSEDVTWDSIFVSGNYAYTGRDAGNEFLILDISDPKNPAAAGSIDTIQNVNSVYVSGKYAYLGIDSGGSNEFRIIDISNPYSPVQVSSVNIGSTIWSVVVHGKYAYLSENNVSENLRIYDISDPTAPVLVSLNDVGTAISKLYISGRYLYAVMNSAAGNDFIIIDISNPKSPSVIGGVDLASNGNEVFVSGRYAYTGHDNDTGNTEFDIIDISNPSQPRIVASVGIGAENMMALFVSGKYAYIGHTDDTFDFRVIDISGIDVPAANIGNIAAGYISVSDNGHIAQNLIVGSGLNVGPRGIMTDGAVGINSTTTASYLSYRFGIASTSPVAQLSIEMNTNSYPVWIGDQGTSTPTFAITGAGRIGIGTSSPVGLFSIEMNASSSPFWIGDQGTTSPIFVITSGGNIGISTSSPINKFSVIGKTYLDSDLITFASSSAKTLTVSYQAAATSTIPDATVSAWAIATSTDKTAGRTASPILSITTVRGQKATTSVIGGFSVDNGAFQYNHGSGITQIDSLELGPLSFADNAGIISWIDMPVTSSGGGQEMSYSAQIDGTSLLTVYATTTAGGGIGRSAVGIASSTPWGTFSIEIGSTTPVMVIADSGTTTPTLWISGDNKLGFMASTSEIDSGNVPTGSVLIGMGALCVDNGGNNCDDAARSRGIVHSTGADVTNIDVAENYPVSEDTILEPGDLVMIDAKEGTRCIGTKEVDENGTIGCSKTETSIIPFVTKSTDSQRLIGVVSTEPGVLLGGFGYKDYIHYKKAPVALVGRVPMKVNPEGGSIKPGDRITLSSIPGVGAKATSSGMTVGIALEGLSEIKSPEGDSSFQDTHKILVFVNLSYTKLAPEIGNGTLDLTGNSIDQTTGKIIKLGGTLDLAGEDIINVRRILSSTGFWSIDEGGLLQVKEVRAEKLCLGSTCVTEEELKALLENINVVDVEPIKLEEESELEIETGSDLNPEPKLGFEPEPESESEPEPEPEPEQGEISEQESGSGQESKGSEPEETSEQEQELEPELGG